MHGVAGAGPEQAGRGRVGRPSDEPAARFGAEPTDTVARDPQYAERSIAEGSKSFAAASRLLPPEVRSDVARLYAWCRHCDDVIDGQVMGHGGAQVTDAEERLAALTLATDTALAGRATGDPVFDGFGTVARERAITPRLAHDLLRGFAMDVAGRTYVTETELCEYCYGVAGAVGVMMALVLRVPADQRDTLDRACDLGIAFQMTNIARDVVADAATGRVYLPADWLAGEGVAPTADAVADPDNAAGVFRATERLLGAAERYYVSAEVGIARLPPRAAWAIGAASSIYRAIGDERLRGGAGRLAARAKTSRAVKLRLIVTSAVGVLSRRARRLEQSRDGLWRRPERP